MQCVVPLHCLSKMDCTNVVGVTRCAHARVERCGGKKVINFPHELRPNLALAGCLTHPGTPPVGTRGEHLLQELEHLAHHLTVHVRAGRAMNGQKWSVLLHCSQRRFLSP